MFGRKPYPAPKPLGDRIHRVVVVAVPTVLVLLSLGSWLLPGLDTHRDGVPLKCSGNLRQTGLALKMYANQFKNDFPADLGSVLLTQDITADVFICPASQTDHPTTAPSKPLAAKDLANPVQHHCSYIYVGRGLRDDTIDADDVVAFEAQPNASLNGYHFSVLFGDGHVDIFYPPDKLSSVEAIKHQHLIADFATGVRPLRLR